MASLNRLPDELLHMIVVLLAGEPPQPYKTIEPLAKPDEDRLTAVRQLKDLRLLTKRLARVAIPFLFCCVKPSSTAGTSPSFETALRLTVARHIRLSGAEHIYGRAARRLLPSFEALHSVQLEDFCAADMPELARCLNAKSTVQVLKLKVVMLRRGLEKAECHGEQAKAHRVPCVKNLVVVYDQSGIPFTGLRGVLSWFSAVTDLDLFACDDSQRRTQSAPRSWALGWAHMPLFDTVRTLRHRGDPHYGHIFTRERAFPRLELLHLGVLSALFIFSSMSSLPTKVRTLILEPERSTLWSRNGNFYAERFMFDRLRSLLLDTRHSLQHMRYIRPAHSSEGAWDVERLKLLNTHLQTIIPNGIQFHMIGFPRL